VYNPVHERSTACYYDNLDSGGDVCLGNDLRRCRFPERKYRGQVIMLWSQI
jgi:hypothetical protein